MNAQQATEQRTSRGLKPRYLITWLITGLSLLALVFVYLAMRPDSSSSRLMKQLVGTWVLPTGNSATFHANGTATDQRSDGTASAHQYQWSLVGNVISLELIKKKQNLMDSVEDSIKRFMGDARVENYRIDKFNKDSLTLTNLENNITFLWQRAEKAGVEIPD